MKAGKAPRSWSGGRHQSSATTMLAGRVRRSCLFIGSLSVLLQDAWGWWLWEKAPVLEEPIPFNLTVEAGNEVGWEWLEGGIRASQVAANAANLHHTAEERPPAIPEQWDSGACMDSWGVPELQREIDPRGYIVFREGREQLGNNRFLLSDGIAIAKALNRTLVEFPMKDSRIDKPDAQLGFCAYWDCARLCSYHRILDIFTFRSMLREGFIEPNDFVEVTSADREQTLMPSLVSADNITNFFEEYDSWQVIVMKMAWKSGLRREPVDLLSPNPYYLDVVDRLLGTQKGWEGGQHMAVQWRTETSTGNLTQCYERYVVPAIEQQRRWLGLGRNQVFFNTDLVGQASTTYNTSVVLANQGVLNMIRDDYPKAMDNAVYDCLDDIEDAGVKAMISGLVSASSTFLLSSSFNTSSSSECQKHRSKYIDLVAEWRFDMLHKDLDSVGQMFPGLEEESGWGAQWGAQWPMHVAGLMGVVVLGGVLAAKMDILGRVKRVKLS